VTIIVLIISRQSPLPVLRDISWGVLPLVAGLFILVAGVEQTGILNSGTQMLHNVAASSTREASFGGGIIVALCVYRKLKPARNDGEARRGSGVNE
jgi:arsenical pump membrane protein